MQGGMALEHASSTILKFWRTPSKLIIDDVQVSDGLILQRPVGTEVSWTAEKHRGEGMGQAGNYNFYNKGDHVGVDLASEVSAYGVEFGIVSKSGNWLSYGEEKRNGAPAFEKYLRQNPDIMQKVYGEILDKSI